MIVAGVSLVVVAVFESLRLFLAEVGVAVVAEESPLLLLMSFDCWVVDITFLLPVPSLLPSLVAAVDFWGVAILAEFEWLFWVLASWLPRILDL